MKKIKKRFYEWKRIKNDLKFAWMCVRERTMYGRK